MKKLISLLLVYSFFIMTICSHNILASYDTWQYTDISHTQTSAYFSAKNLLSKGIVTPKSATKFGVQDCLTRKETAKIVVLAAGVQLSGKSGTFTDVVKNSTYEPYIETANLVGIMFGTGSGAFNPDVNVSRQDAAVIIKRFAEYKKISIEKVSNYSVSDLSSITASARDSVVSLVNMNVIGLDNGTNKFRPNDYITKIDFCIWLDRILSSDGNQYSDWFNDWMPVDKEISELDSELVAQEDFENGLTDLDGFERSIIGSQNATHYIVNTMGKDSSHSIEVTSNGGDYSAVNLYFRNISPGSDYYCTWDVETVNLGDAYVRVCFDWYNADGNLGGAFERNNDISGDNDWKNQSFITTAPDPGVEPKFLRIAITLRGQTNGAAYIDNFKIHKVVYNPLTSYLEKPAYKGIITEPNGEADIRVSSYVKSTDYLNRRNEYSFEAKITDRNGIVIMNSEIPEISEKMQVTFSSKKLSIGDYDLTLLLKKGESNVAENHWIIRKRTPDFKTKYSFDKYGRFLKNDVPYFGIGAYAIGLEESDLEDFKNTPIDFMVANSLGRYWENNNLFKKMSDYGLSSIINFDSIYKNAMRGQYQNSDVTNIASERAVMEKMVDDLNLPEEDGHMGYQINNEFPYSSWADRISWHNQILSEIDLDHITYGVGDGGELSAINYARCHDIYASDPYPITGAANDEIWKVYEHAKGLYNATKNRPIWTAIQISDLKVMGGNYASRLRGPSEQELRNMAWQAVCAGSQGIVWYAHFHLDKNGVSRPKSETFPEVLRVSDEVKKHENVIMSTEDAPDVRISADDMSKLAYLVKRYNEKTYVFIVNMSSSTQNVGLYLDGASSVTGEYSKKSYEPSVNGKVDLQLSGLEVEVLVAEQDRQTSPRCEMAGVQFSNDDNFYFTATNNGENVIYVPNSIEKISYKTEIPNGARIIVNGCPNKEYGMISLTNRDEIRFNVISEDGQHWKQTFYRIVRI